VEVVAVHAKLAERRTPLEAGAAYSVAGRENRPEGAAVDNKDVASRDIHDDGGVANNHRHNHGQALENCKPASPREQ
jgi:hypothetical protein